MLDTSCAALLRLAQSVHQQGYKVALTGEGADEALAGYVWYKAQKIRDADRPVRSAAGPARLVRKLLMGSIAGRRRPSAAQSWPSAAFDRPSKTSTS